MRLRIDNVLRYCFYIGIEDEDEDEDEDENKSNVSTTTTIVMAKVIMAIISLNIRNSNVYRKSQRHLHSANRSK